MAGEIQIPLPLSGESLYAIVRNTAGQPANTDTEAFEAWDASNYSNYVVNLTEQDNNAKYYVGDFPDWIAAGRYYVTIYRMDKVFKQFVQPLIGDEIAGHGTLDWSGEAVLGLGDAGGDIAGALASYGVPTTSNLASAVSPLATTSQLATAVSGLATASGLGDAVAPLATASGVTTAVNNAVSSLATAADLAAVKVIVEAIQEAVGPDADGISDVRFREIMLAFAAHANTVTDNGNGTNTVVFKNKAGDTVLTVTYAPATGQRSASEIAEVEE